MNIIKKNINDYNEQNDALNVLVKISWHEAEKIVIRDLIEKRNCPTNRIKNAFDEVLRYYLDENEFKKYVIDGFELK